MFGGLKTDPLTQVLLHFLRVNAQMHNLDKQKTAQGLKPLAASVEKRKMDKFGILFIICIVLNFLTFTYSKILRQKHVFLVFLILSIVFYIIGLTKSLGHETNDKFEYVIMTGWFYYLITFYWFRQSFLKKYAREPIVERFGIDYDTMERANTFDKYFVALIIIIPILLTLLTKYIINFLT